VFTAKKHDTVDASFSSCCSW